MNACENDAANYQEMQAVFPRRITYPTLWHSNSYKNYESEFSLAVEICEA